MTDLQRLIAEEWERGDEPPTECTCGTAEHPSPCPIGAELFENWKADLDAEQVYAAIQDGSLVCQPHNPDEVPF